jgi:hypothetical protein
LSGSQRAGCQLFELPGNLIDSIRSSFQSGVRLIVSAEDGQLISSREDVLDAINFASLATLAVGGEGALARTILLPAGRVGAIGTIDASLVRFTQSSVKSTFSNGTSLNVGIDALRAGGAEAAAKFPPIRIFEKDGLLFTLDNRRLLVFSQAGQKVPFKFATQREVLRETTGPFSKFTTTEKQGMGQFITVRGSP